MKKTLISEIAKRISENIINNLQTIAEIKESFNNIKGYLLDIMSDEPENFGDYDPDGEELIDWVGYDDDKWTIEIKRCFYCRHSHTGDGYYTPRETIYHYQGDTIMDMNIVYYDENEEEYNITEMKEFDDILDDFYSEAEEVFSNVKGEH